MNVRNAHNVAGGCRVICEMQPRQPTSHGPREFTSAPLLMSSSTMSGNLQATQQVHSLNQRTDRVDEDHQQGLSTECRALVHLPTAACKVQSRCACTARIASIDVLTCVQVRRNDINCTLFDCVMKWVCPVAGRVYTDSLGSFNMCVRRACSCQMLLNDTAAVSWHEWWMLGNSRYCAFESSPATVVSRVFSCLRERYPEQHSGHITSHSALDAHSCISRTRQNEDKKNVLTHLYLDKACTRTIRFELLTPFSTASAGCQRAQHQLICVSTRQRMSVQELQIQRLDRVNS